MSVQPNILLVTTHDSGRHFGCYGVPSVHTPNIDRLAAEGVRLGQCFGTAPICCAARAAMLTGMYPQSNGQMDLCFPPFNRELHEPQWHASHVFRQCGYETILLGFQHELQDPARLGFDERRLPWPSTPNATEVASAVADFLASPRPTDRPFYAQVGFFKTHSPLDWKECAPDASLGVYVPPQLRRIATRSLRCIRRARARPCVPVGTS